MKTLYPPPLLSVRVLFEAKPAFAGLEPIVLLTSAFLDWSVELTLAAACRIEIKSERYRHKLLDRLWDIGICKSNADGSGESWSLSTFLHTDRHYLQFQFRQSLMLAIKLQHSGTIEWLLKHCTDCVVPVEVVQEAAKVGDLSTLKLFHEAQTGRSKIVSSRHEVCWGGRDAELAAANGHSNVVWWLLRTAPAERYVNRIFSAAIRSGDMPLMEWLIGQGLYPSRHGSVSLVDAASSGCLEVVVWVYNLGITRGDDDTMLTAAMDGYLDIMEWLLDHRLGCGSLAAFNSAIMNDQLESAQLLDSRFDLMDYGRYFEEAMIAAAGTNLRCVKWLLSEFADDPDIDLFMEPEVVDKGEPSTALDAAARWGNLEIVKYLHNFQQDVKRTRRKRRKEGRKKKRGGSYRGRGVTSTSDAMDYAAENGYLEMVQWLHTNRSEGCTTRAMNKAAKNGNLEMVRWLHEHRTEGCTARAMDKAAGKGQLHVVKWLHEHRREGCTTDAMDRAAANGHLRVVKWLQERRSEGCTTSAMDGAAQSGHLKVVKWLHEHRSEGCTAETFDGAAAGGHLEIVRWLHANRSEGCTHNAMARAAKREHFEILLLLRSLHCEPCRTVDTAKLLPEIRAWLMDNYDL